MGQGSGTSACNICYQIQSIFSAITLSVQVISITIHLTLPLLADNQELLSTDDHRPNDRIIDPSVLAECQNLFDRFVQSLSPRKTENDGIASQSGDESISGMYILPDITSENFLFILGFIYWNHHIILGHPNN